jgi:hypothetical protein
VVVDGEGHAVGALGEVGAEAAGVGGAGGGAEIGLDGEEGLAAGEGVGGVVVDGESSMVTVT